METNYVDKIEFICNNCDMFYFVNSGERLALLEYLFFEIADLNQENIEEMLKMYNKFDEKLSDSVKIPHFKQNYLNVGVLLREFRDYIMSLDKVYNKKEFNNKIRIIKAIINQYADMYYESNGISATKTKK